MNAATEFAVERLARPTSAADGGHEVAVGQLPEAAGSSVLVVGRGGPGDWDHWRESQSADAADAADSADSADSAGSVHADDDVVLQLYTSGTTGKPEGAMLTRRSRAACIPDTVAVWQLDSSSVMLSVLPMFHIAGAGTVVASLWARSCLVIDNDPSPDNMLRLIESKTAVMRQATSRGRAAHRGHSDRCDAGHR